MGNRHLNNLLEITISFGHEWYCRVIVIISFKKLESIIWSRDCSCYTWLMSLTPSEIVLFLLVLLLCRIEQYFYINKQFIPKHLTWWILWKCLWNTQLHAETILLYLRVNSFMICKNLTLRMQARWHNCSIVRKLLARSLMFLERAI